MNLKDIQDIPYFAYSPGIYAWCALACLIVLSISVFKYFSSRKRASNFKALEKSLIELRRQEQSLAENQDYKEAIFNSSMLVRRAVSHVESEDISTLSESELKSRQTSCSAGLKKLLGAIIEIEKSKYSPGLNLDNTRSLIKNLIITLSDYKSQHELDYIKK